MRSLCAISGTRVFAAAVSLVLAAGTASAVTEGPLFPNAAAHSLWTNINNVKASDNANATTSTDGASIEATDFGFAIPSNAVVMGIEVQVERFKTGSANIRDSSIKLIQGGVTQGSDLALGGNWPETETVQTYGGPAGLWGLSWTPDQINSASFGLQMIIEKIGGSTATANVDAISITVYYDLPTPTPTPSPSPTETPTPTPSETETPTPTPTETETPTPSETETPTPSPTVTPSPTPDILEIKSMNVQTGGNFGVSVAGIADFTGDGKGDLIIGAHTEKTGGGPDFAGRTYLFDGATGTSLTMLVSPLQDRDGNAGRNVQGIADLNADGRNELLVASWQEEPAGGPEDAGRIHLYDGASRALIRTIDSPNPETGGKFGARVSGGGDVNGDGKQDIVVGAPNEDVFTTTSLADAGRTYVFSGATGGLLRTFVSPSPKAGGLFGFFAALVYDLNNDVRGDIIVGAYRENAGGVNNAGRVHAYSGRNSALLYSLQSPNPSAAGEFGRNVARHFDLTGDARVDVVVGAPFEEGAGQPQNSGLVHIYRGSDGAYLRTLQSPFPNAFGRFGLCVQSIPDINGDFLAETLVGEPLGELPGNPADSGAGFMFDGATGNLLWIFGSPNAEASAQFGTFIHGVQDNDGDGRWEVLVGARLEDVDGKTDAGRAYLFRSRGF